MLSFSYCQCRRGYCAGGPYRVNVGVKFDVFLLRQSFVALCSTAVHNRWIGWCADVVSQVMALPQKSGAQRLKEYLDLSLFLFKRTPLLKQEALKAHFQRYHKVRQACLVDESADAGRLLLTIRDVFEQHGLHDAKVCSSVIQYLPF